MNRPSLPVRGSRLPLKPPEMVLSLASGFAGVLLPAVCFLLASGGSPDAPDWQSGQFDDYVSLLLGGNTTWVFYPFLAYSVACLLVVLSHPPTANRYFLVRLGVYSGVILALHFVCVMGVVRLEIHDLKSWRSIAKAVLGIPLWSLLGVAVPVVGWLLLWNAVRMWQRYTKAMTLLAISLGWAVLGVVIAIGISDVSGGNLGELLGPVVFAPVDLLIFAPLVFAPTWAAAVYTYHSVRLVRLRRTRLQLQLWQFLAVISWFAAYFAAWRAGILLMWKAYAQLPVEEQGDCYIATAAARGHGHFVGAWEVVCRDGTIRRVNLQLAHFKCAELALLATTPQTHRILRGVYDRVGPQLANWLAHPVAADIAYLALKPWEYLTRLALNSLVGDMSPIARKMYR